MPHRILGFVILWYLGFAASVFSLNGSFFSLHSTPLLFQLKSKTEEPEGADFHVLHSCESLNMCVCITPFAFASEFP